MRRSSFGYSALVLIGALAAVCANAQTPAIEPLSANDVSWLFPPPKQASDLGKLISIVDLKTPNSKDATKSDPVWPDAAFQRFLEIAGSQAAQVAGTQNRIGLPAAAQSRAAWFIAGVRIDAGAPGLSPDIRGQFGQSPEIRLILQLVTKDAAGAPIVNDIAAHLIFDFITTDQDGAPQAGCRQRPKPDDAQLRAIVADLAALRSKLSTGQLGASKIVTSNFPLGVHPGLLDATTAINVQSEMKSFLLKHLSGGRLDAMAIMGIPANAPVPWIFLSMAKVPPGVVPTLPNGGFVPVPGPVLDGAQFAQSFAPPGTIPAVVPQPQTNNLNPITCKNAALPPPGNLPSAARNGVSTSQLFLSPPPGSANAKSILDVIADPAKSHFFNTDCVSCHTETRRARSLLQMNSVPGIDSAVLPKTDWTLRNFGWSPPIEGPVQAVVTRRTGAETDAVVAFINSQVLNH